MLVGEGILGYASGQICLNVRDPFCLLGLLLCCVFLMSTPGDQESSTKAGSGINAEVDETGVTFHSLKGNCLPCLALQLLLMLVHSYETRV